MMNVMDAEQLLLRLNAEIGETIACMADDAVDAEATGERPDLLEYHVSIPLDDARDLADLLASVAAATVERIKGNE